MTQEKEMKAKSGLGMLVFLLLALFVLVPGVAVTSSVLIHPAMAAPFAILELVLFVYLFGFFMVAPNESRVIQLFGRYIGTVNEPGLRWANPFFSKSKISLALRSFESTHLKVNDLDGNPVEIGAVVVWKVQNTYDAFFQVDDVVKFVHVQTEAAVRNLAMRFPYDVHDDLNVSLRGHTGTIAHELQSEVQARLMQAGVHIVEARITHLAYAPEIAQAMLQRQQAGAIIAARTRIVEGAVGMVELALAKLSERHIVELDPERKAQMVSNLLVVLCGERGTQPVLNTGSIHQ